MTATESSPRLRYASRCRYLTARCPTGCESWLHPRALEAHVGPNRCVGEPWVDRIEDSALVAEPMATMFRQRLSPTLVGPVNVSDDRVLRLRRTNGVRDEVLQGLVVRSPVEGVRARRWLAVVKQGIERDGPQAIDLAATPAGFRDLERELQVDDWLVECPDCGTPIKRSRINAHQARSTLCRWSRAAAEVQSLWAAGWRDPVSVPGGPQSWGALQSRAAWRRRVHTVEFPLWVAVLLTATT